VSARLVSAVDGTELAAFRETADGEDELMGALGRLSRSVRERAGESLRTIRASTELERVTTPSLPALRRYAEASAIFDRRGEADRALELLREAVELDTAFAMAWRRMAVALNNARRDPPAAIAAIATAYRHRDRLTDMERALTEAYYYSRGPEPDRRRALAAYETALRLDSTSTVALNNAGVILIRIREYAKAETLQLRALDVPRPFGGTYVALVSTQILLGKIAAAESTLSALRQAFPESESIRISEMLVAWAKGDRSGAEAAARAVVADEGGLRSRYLGGLMGGSFAAMEGRWTESLAWASGASRAQSDASPSAATRFSHALDTARFLAAGRGDAAAAQAALARGLARDPLDSMAPSERPWPRLAELAFLIGDPVLARRVAEGHAQDLAPLAADPEAAQAGFDATTALTERRWADAVRLVHEADAGFEMLAREAHFLLGFAFEQAGQSDSATVYYERYLQTPDPEPIVDGLWRARVHRSLGGLYESRGDVQRAGEQYEQFLDLWQRADPELQPQVREVRARLAGLKRG
jgi:tetratricopeptide (TPR) repeat protein